jgi:DNA-binding MarR family transcriptional regulator
MKKDFVQSAELLLEAKRIWRGAFHEEQSIIPTDILLTVAYRHAEGAPMSMKQLVNDLPHSEAGIKQHLRKLEAKDLVTRQPCQHDGRVVRLLPSSTSIEAIIQIGRQLTELFAPPLNH